jgi:hypothetical protein
MARSSILSFEFFKFFLKKHFKGSSESTSTKVFRFLKSAQLELSIEWCYIAVRQFIQKL